MINSIRTNNDLFEKDSFNLSGRNDKNKSDTVIDIGNVKLGGGNFAIIAGPCTVESEEMIYTLAKAVKKCGANILRGGAYKSRTSPYSFQGLHEEGLKYLIAAGKNAGIPVVSEITSVNDLELFCNIDLIQVGARNMQNFELLKELGKINKPILLKRGFANTVSELLYSAEYIMSSGNSNVILCERGIRSFETQTRFTLDLASVPVLKKLSHLPVIVDPSHSTGNYDLVEPMALAATAAGADGIIIEVHNNPNKALCDGSQAVTPERFNKIVDKVNKIHSVLN